MPPMFVWGLDEAVECIAVVMAAISGLLFVLFTMERSLNTPGRHRSGVGATPSAPERIGELERPEEA